MGGCVKNSIFSTYDSIEQILRDPRVTLINGKVLTISEKMAKDQGDPSLAITPLLWMKKGLPVMLATLITCTIIMYLFWDFFSAPIR